MTSASIDIVFVPDLLAASELKGKTAVAVDILRATSTITVAVANGARSITPVLTPEDAFRVAKAQPGTLIGGERHGVKVEGFDLGNSPREYDQPTVSDRHIVLTTTNGTRTLQACKTAAQILVGSFLNLQAVVAQLEQIGGDVVFACAGREGGFCLEDTLFAGACVEALTRHGVRGFRDATLTDAAEAGRILYREYSRDIATAIKNCYHGKFLTGIGLGADVEFCTQVNGIEVVPRLMGGRIIAE